MRKHLLISIAILIYAAILRVSISHHPFWVDEFSSAQQAKLMNEYGVVDYFTQTDYYAEPNNILTHLIIATSFKTLGVSETSARLPFMIIGSLVPLLVFFYTKKILDKDTALSASLFTATSYFVITWSRQARGYSLQQALLVGLLLAHYHLKKHPNGKYALLFTTIALAGTLTHTLFGLFVFILLADFLWSMRHSFDMRSGMQALVSLFVAVIVLWLAGIIPNVSKALGSLQLHNNVWYYHALIWRQHGLVAILAMLGMLHSARHKLKQTYPMLGIIASQLILVSLILGPYTSRYMVTVFPLLLILAAYALVVFTKTPKLDQRLSKYRIVPLLITLGIIANGDTFTVLPKPYYSVNHTMRDIALVDYDAVYAPVLDAIKSGHSPALIDTWADRARWYTKSSNTSLYWLRWQEESGSINGLPMSTPHYLGEDGKKYIALSGKPNLQLISSEADMLDVMATHETGFIWIDDTSLPQDVISYAEANLHKELYLDHYQYDDNPYSIWPGTLYSWGFE